MKQYLSLLFFFSFFFPTFSFADFSDVGGTSSRMAVEFLQQEGVVNGFPDNTFRPQQNITRAEFLKIALKSKEEVVEECEPTKTFSDVQKSNWYYNVICYAVNNNIVQGYADGTFRPNNPINFRDAAKIIAKVHNIEVPEDAGEEWFSGYLAALQRDRVVPESITDSAKLLTRGEMSEIIWGIATGHEVENQNLGDLPSLTSCEELGAQLQKYEKRNSYGRGMMIRKAVDDAVFEGEMMNDVAAPAAFSEKSAAEYSQTNIQEAGVDEADIIKNDGSHIFLLKKNTIRILEAYPASALKQVATLTLPKNANAREMFLDGNTLTVISSTWGGKRYDEIPVNPQVKRINSEVYYGGGGNETLLTVYDVTDRKHPVKVRSVSFEGNYLSSRRVGDMVYLVAEKGWNIWGIPRPIPYEDILPRFSDSAFSDETRVAGCTDIRYFPNFTHPNYLIVAAINTKDTSQKVTREVVLGGGNEIYSSPENLYVTRPSWQDVYFDNGEDAGWKSEEMTDIYQFSLDGKGVAFSAKGRVPGRVLNQFSMSEYAGYFRIATQVGQAWNTHRKSSSGVYILDKHLREVSRIADIAPGENMKSARFMGNKAYLVTFKTVDPLFVLDLNPTHPKLLGKLKIPGWSDYLHPYDENHLIGFGKEVDESIDADKVHSDNAVYYTAVLGMKLSLFDVSDLEHPKELFKTVIGDRGTDSAVLHDHKALLFDKEKGILGFPVTITKNMNGKTGHEADIQTIFSGAQVYDISLENGFSLRGEVSHYSSDEAYKKSGEYFYGDPNLNIERIIYIGDTFYTISQNMVKALDWNTLAEKASLVLDEPTCSEIRNESECVARSDCRAIYYSSSACYKDSPDGELICEDPKFSHCQEK